MIIAFLQLRTPPVLPALHQRPHQKRPPVDGRATDFADDLDKLRGFGRKNKESLGELLFQFFRFYAHEFDYDKLALSIRLGRTITKAEKKWHTALNNMLCVEEPFNTVRNLSNTADDTSFRGLHMELRRAFDLIALAKLDECCEQFVFPKEEERIFQKPSAPRPVMVRSASQQGSGRGGRGGNYRGRGFHRNGNKMDRRASSSVAYENHPVYIHAANMPGATLSPQEMQWYQQAQQQAQAQAQQQFPFHPEIISSTLNALQIQEQSLRFQLYTQSQAFVQHQALAHAQRMQGSGPAPATDRPRTNSFDNPPLTAPIRPDMYMYAMPYQPPYFSPPQQGVSTTLPSSPSTASAVPEFRRSLHRTNAGADPSASGNASHRSQSQPAARTSMPGVQSQPSYPGSTHSGGTPAFPPRLVNGVPIPSFIPDENADGDYDDAPSKTLSESPTEEDGPRTNPSYYVSESSSPARPVNIGIANGIPSFGDLGQQSSQSRRRLSTDQSPQSILDRRMRRTSRSPSPLGHARAFSVGTNTAPLPSVPFPQAGPKIVRDARPLIVNGSAFKSGPSTGSSRVPSTSDSMASDESAFDNPLRINQGPMINSVGLEPPMVLQPVPTAEPSPAFPDRPLIVNGSTQPLAASPQQVPDRHSFGQRVAAMGGPNPVPYATVASNNLNGIMQLSPSGRSRVMTRQQQNGIAPLDLAMPEHSFAVDLQHLSPVYETRTPSPTAVRKFDGPFAHNTVNLERFSLAQGAAGALKDSRKEHAGVARSSQRSPTDATSIKQDLATTGGPVNTRVNGLAARENGHVRGAKSESDNASGWQKAKPRKKPAGGDAKAVASGHVNGEQLPRHESDRKGG